MTFLVLWLMCLLVRVAQVVAPAMQPKYHKNNALALVNKIIIVSGKSAAGAIMRAANGTHAAMRMRDLFACGCNLLTTTLCDRVVMPVMFF